MAARTLFSVAAFIALTACSAPPASSGAYSGRARGRLFNIIEGAIDQRLAQWLQFGGKNIYRVVRNSIWNGGTSEGPELRGERFTKAHLFTAIRGWIER